MPNTLIVDDRCTAPFAFPSVGAVELLGRSPAVTRAQELVRRAAALRGGVLITAEPGADIESVTRELHVQSAQSTGAYVVVDCDRGDPSGVDRLLFGTPQGEVATDLDSVSSDSRVAAARGGTLFLQHVTELPSGVQARLARITRDGEVRIAGEPVATGFRLVASAPPTIDADVHARRFRPDLYRRLSSMRIDLPPLRDRAGDVPALAARLLADLSAARGLPPRTFTQATLALIGALTWPGNMAELRDAIERVVTSTSQSVIQIEHLLPALRLDRVPAAFVPAANLREARLRFERDYISAVLQHHRWRMADASHALGIQRPNLYRKARQLGIPISRGSE